MTHWTARAAGGGLLAGLAAVALVAGLLTPLTADTVGFLLVALPAVLYALAGVASAVTAATAVTMVTVGTGTLTLDLPTGVATPCAGVRWLATDFTAVAGRLGPTAGTAAAA